MKIAIALDPKHGYGLQLNKRHLQLIKSAAPGATVKVIEISPQAIIQDGHDAEIILSSGFPDISLDQLPKFKWLHVTSAGVNALPQSFMKSNVLLTNSSGVHPIPIAEQIFGYMLMFTRNLHIAHRNQITKKKWITVGQYTTISEISGKTIGIVGLGRIGQKVAHFAKAFDMNVIAITKNTKKRVKNVDQLLDMKKLDTLLKQSDYVVNCLPSTKETYHLYGSKQFGRMKPSAYFINIGRGDSVNEKELIDALKKKQISGAGLDVFETEPLADKSELWKLENVILSPHTAGNTPHYLDRVIDIFCVNLKAYLAKKKMPTLVDKKRGY